MVSVGGTRNGGKITILPFYTIISLPFSFTSLCSDVDIVLNCSDPQSCFLVPPIMLKLWIFGLLVAYLRNFYSKKHYFLAEPRYDVSFLSLFLCSFSSAICDLFHEIIVNCNISFVHLAFCAFVSVAVSVIVRNSYLPYFVPL
jgi:hypothetical protein